MGDNATEPTSYETVKTWVESPAMQEIFTRTLPPGMDAGAWSGAALAYIRTAKDLQYAEPLSITGGLITIASLGLRMDGVMGQAYLTARTVKEKDPQTNRWKIVRYEAQVQLGYKGMLVLAYRNTDIQEIESIITHQVDFFDFQKGSKQFLTHRWKLNEARGDMVGVYAGVRFKNGYYSFQVFDIVDVLDLRLTILTQNGIRIEETPEGPVYHKKEWGNKGWRVMGEEEAKRYPWIGHLRPMVVKTGVRWAQKFWPTIGSEFSRAADLMAIDDAGLSQGLASTAAELMPKELRHEVEAQPGFDPGAAQAPKVRSRVRGEQLTAKMLAEATAGQGDKAEAKPEEPPKPKKEKKPDPEPKKKKSDLKGATKGKSQPQKPQTPPQETKAPAAGQSPSSKKEAPEPPPGDPSEMTEEEIAEAMQREQDEWEASLADRKDK